MAGQVGLSHRLIVRLPPPNKNKERNSFEAFRSTLYLIKKKNEQNNSLNCAIMHQIFVIPLLIFFQSNSQECATFVHSSRARTLKKKRTKLPLEAKQPANLAVKSIEMYLKIMNEERKKKKKTEQIDHVVYSSGQLLPLLFMMNTHKKMNKKNTTLPIKHFLSFRRSFNNTASSPSDVLKNT